ncbi:uncharacterized protein LOC117335527 [Pecten maximus]|uniref:uncharacterized protein LOC117335527 n=1 Tax=Pecten maximus TaxID=6579 RepID=UPI001458038A|nr:uncharacterized protein LOC117335527 [Pecten maximus]
MICIFLSVNPSAPPLQQTNELAQQTGGSSSGAVGIGGIMAELQESHNLQNDLRQLVRESRRRFNTNLIRAISARIRNESQTNPSRQHNNAMSGIAVDSIVDRPRPSADPNGLSPFEVDVDSINPFAASATTVSPPSRGQLRPQTSFRSSFSGRQNMMSMGVFNNPAGGVPVFLPTAAGAPTRL